MAAKKTITTTVEQDGDGIETEKPEALDEDVIRALTELEGADEITWTVTRLSEPNSGFCGEMSTVEISKRRIAEAYGPGRYRVQGTRPDGKYFKSGRISIASPLANAGDKTAELLESLKGSKSGDTSMMPLLLAMISSNSAIVTAALARPTEPKKEIPWAGLLAAAPVALTAVKEFFKNDTDSQSMEKLLKQLTILEKLKGDDKGGSSWPDIIRDGLQSMREMATLAGGRPVQHIPATVVPATSASVRSGATVATALTETPEAVEPTQENLTMDWLKKKLDELLQNAAQNKDPELRAELLLDDLPEFIPESVIKTMLGRDDWFEQLCAFDQRVLSYHGWFTELRACVLETIDPDGVDEHARKSNPDRNRTPESETSTSQTADA